MNERQKSLLVIQYHDYLTDKTREKLKGMIHPMAEQLGVEALILDCGMTAQIHSDQEPLIDALHRQTEAMERQTQVLTALVAAMAGEMMSDPDAAVPIGLNGKPAL